MGSTWHGEMLNKGEIVRCKDKLDMLITDQALMQAGYVTDYIYKYNMIDVYWIEIKGRVKDGKSDTM